MEEEGAGRGPDRPGGVAGAAWLAAAGLGGLAGALSLALGVVTLVAGSPPGGTFVAAGVLLVTGALAIALAAGTVALALREARTFGWLREYHAKVTEVALSADAAAAEPPGGHTP